MRATGGATSARALFIGTVLLLLSSASCAADRPRHEESFKESSRVQAPSILGERLRAGQVERSVGEGSEVLAAAAPAAAQEASVIEVIGVQVQAGAAGATILVTADGLLSDYESFALPDPPRLVIDLPHARHAIPQPVALSAGSPILKVRTTQYRERPVPIVRLVFDLAHLLPYRLELTGNQMQILVSEEAAEGAPLAQRSKQEDKPVRVEEPAEAHRPAEPAAAGIVAPPGESAMPSEQRAASPGEETAKKGETAPSAIATPGAEKATPWPVGAVAQPMQTQKQESSEPPTKAVEKTTPEATKALVPARPAHEATAPTTEHSAPPPAADSPKKEGRKPLEAPTPVAEIPMPGPVDAVAQPMQTQKQESPEPPTIIAEKTTPEPTKTPASARPSATSKPPVVEVTGVQVQAGAGGATILVTADGLLSDYESFALPDPPRLVIDLPHARHAIPQPVALPAGSPILKVRTTQYRERPVPIVRLVFDLAAALPFKTERIENGLEISLGEVPKESAPPPSVATRPKREEVPKQPPLTRQKPPPIVSTKRPGPEPGRAPSPEVPKLAEIPAPVSPTEEQAPPAPPVPQKTPLAASSRISLDFKRADLEDLLRLISEVSGLNIVAADSVRAVKDPKVTIRLVSVEWRQALDLILRSKDLSYEQDGNVIYVGSRSEIQKAKLDRAEDIRKADEAIKKMEQEARLREIQIEEEKRKAEGERRKAEEARKKAEEEERRYAEEPQCTKVIQLAHTKASEVKKHLDPLKTRRGSVEVDERTNTIIVNDVQSACLKMAAIAKDLDAPPKDPFVTRLIPFNYAKAADLRTSFAPLKTPQGTVIVDERSSRVIIKDLPPVVEKMEMVLKQIDIPTPQVLIEARIVEASRQFSQSLGVQWGGGSLLTTPGRSPVTLFGGSSQATGTGGITFPLAGQTAGPGPVPFPGPVPLALNLPALASGASPFALGATIGTLSNKLLLGIQLSAAEREGRIRTLSSPRVATQDNEEAEIKQGTQVPFTTIDASGRTVVSFQDAFIKLKVKPHITPDGRVSMKVEAERSFAGDRIDFSGGFAFPINTRKATTNILVQNGSTVVIGGLLQSTEQIAEDRVPVLGRIPILGWLFKRQSIGPDERVELLIFLTPSVLQESRL